LGAAVVDGLGANTVVVTSTGDWTVYRRAWQFSGAQGLDEAYVPFFGAFGTPGRRHGRALERRSARDALAGDGCGVRDVWWREWDPPASARRLVVVIAEG